MSDSRLAVNLKELRLNRGLSVAAAAEEMDVKEATLRNAEGGQIIPRPSNAHKIARFYGFDRTEVWPLKDSERVAA